MHCLRGIFSDILKWQLGQFLQTPGRFVVDTSSCLAIMLLYHQHFDPMKRRNSYCESSLSGLIVLGTELDDQISCGVDPIAPVPTLPKDEEMVAKLKSAFDAIAGDANDIEAEDLRNILNRAFENKVGQYFEGFSLETARSMVALMDVDTSGTLEFEEFKILWYELRLWLTIFKEADSENTGRLRTYDLRNVLADIGIKISNEIFKAIVCRYAHDGFIVFDDFVLLLVRLITVFGKFKENLDQRGGNKATFNVDVFLRCVLYT
ncbi:hypothetical protein Aperf_G00000106167 [Anoplocephala perfoliata]